MYKLWLIAKGEYIKRVGKKTFLIGTLLIPIIFGVIIGVTVLIIERDKDLTPFGYVDFSGVLDSNRLNNLDDEMIEIIAFPTKEAAMEALEEGRIQGFHVIPEDFLVSQEVDLYYLDEYPDNSILRDFDDYVRTSLLPNGPDRIQKRIIDGSKLSLHSADGKRKFDQEFGLLSAFFPMIVAMFFIFSVMGASGYFLQAITDEKENRTMEIMITSLSPWQLIGGKSLGLLGVALTQMCLWLISASAAWIIAGNIFPELDGVILPWDILLIFIVFFVPTFALIGGLMAAIGGAVTELQEGQQIAGILNLLFTFPLFLTALVFADPNSPFLVFLSFWPTTSFLTITLRWGFSIIPIWQISVSWIILVFSGIVTVWTASRIFRIGMLSYGQRLSLKIITSVFKRSEKVLG